MAKTKKVRTRKHGKTWSYIFEAGQVNGKRKVVEKGGFATEKDAYNAGVEAYTDFMHGNIGITSEAITLKDFMTSWLEEVVAVNVRPTTLQSYKNLLKLLITPCIRRDLSAPILSLMSRYQKTCPKILLSGR